MSRQIQFVKPDWPAPKNVKAVTTTRIGGASLSKYQSFNIATHVGDNAALVKENRHQLKQALNLKSDPFWLEQVHGTECLEYRVQDSYPIADASFSNARDEVLTVMTADCLPILFTNTKGNWVAACHAGWRGLADGIIEKTVAAYDGESSELIAWIGPAISQKYFEVGDEVRQQFIDLSKAFNEFFETNSQGRFQFDFIGLAKSILTRLDVTAFGGNLCSYADFNRFYSYRRDGETGRMASLIWME